MRLPRVRFSIWQIMVVVAAVAVNAAETTEAARMRLREPETAGLEIRLARSRPREFQG